MSNKKESWGNIELPGLNDEELLNTNWNRKWAAQEVCQRPEWHQRRSEAAKQQFADPELRQRHSESVRKATADPEYRQRRSELAKQRCADPEFRQRRSELAKQRSADPEYRQNMSRTKTKKYIHTPWGKFESLQECAQHVQAHNLLPTRKNINSIKRYIQYKLSSDLDDFYQSDKQEN